MSQPKKVFSDKRPPGRPQKEVKTVMTGIRLPEPTRKALISESLKCKVKLATLIQAILKAARPDLPWE